MRCFVGFDTSNYTTSAAVCDENGVVIANIKRPLPVKEGERGLRQSDAVFAHVKNLPSVTDELSRVLLGRYDCVAVGVSATPRKAENSYMPCFLCGQAAAHSFAAANGVTVFETAHQDGHIMSALYSSGAFEKLMQRKFLAFHVSGGTTEALLVTPNESKTDFDITLVGQTNDINAGQAIDRVGVELGLSFPCGKELEKLATSYDGAIEKKKISVNDGSCSLSGVENIAKKIYAQTGSREQIAAFVFDFICRTLCEMTEQIMAKHGQMPVLFAGGVMSNMLMRERISARFDAHFADAQFSADNAAGVALICRLKAIEGGLL